MCAEADHLHCHRQLLADHLAYMGNTVRHITGPQRALAHIQNAALGDDREPPVYTSSLSGLANRREVVGERGQMCAHSRRKLRLFNEKARAYGPLSRRRSRFGLSPTGC